MHLPKKILKLGVVILILACFSRGHQASAFELDVSIVNNSLRINSCSSQLPASTGYKGYINNEEVFTTGTYGGFPCFNGDLFISDLTSFVAGYPTPLTLRFDFYSNTSFTPPVYASFTVYYDGSEFTLTEEPVYSSLYSDTSEQIGSSFNHIIQTLGTNLRGTLTRVDLKSSNPKYLYYADQPIIELHECEDSIDGDPTFNGSNCTPLFAGFSSDISQLEISTQSFYTNPIVFNPSKYYVLATRGGNIFNTLPFFYGSTQDTVEGACYQRYSSSAIYPCATISDLYFNLYGISKSSPPPPDACTTDCFSNVLFLPGIKGSILKSGSDTLWPPTVWSNDIDQLALDENGESVEDIQVEKILDSFYGTSIYAPFSDFMDGISGGGNSINEWLPLAYDWRFSPETIVENGIKTSDGDIDVIARIEELATNSKTGKVVIIAHSMGGLLGKAIIKKLEEEGKDNLIESFVMIGSPQLGTPQTIASMLHGDQESIPGSFGFVTNRIDMRKLAQNMPSAYDLLPSEKYFDQVLDPVVIFDEDAEFTEPWRNLWSSVVNNYSNFTSFLTGGGVRTKPDEFKTRIPEILNSNLLTDSTNFHNEYDNYQIPDNIRVVQVAGWGRPTVKAVEYKTEHGEQSYDVIPTREGDTTVVYPSAVSSVADETYFFDLFEFNKAINSNTQHRDLLSTDPIQDLLQSILMKQVITENNFILNIKPTVTNLEDQLVVSSNSPVVLGARDEAGNFTGIDSEQDLSAELLSIKEEIPGSTFLHTGESQYIFLPKEGVYDFVYKGIGNGPTTLDIENFSADTVTPIISYEDLPTKSGTEATFTIESANPQNTELMLDLDGDGDNDLSLTSSQGGEAITLYPFHGFLQPINDTTYQADQKPSVFKAGSTVPVKFQLKKPDGSIMQTNTLPIWLSPKAISSMSASVDESVYTLPVTVGSNFKWDSTSQQYIYNWSTKGFLSGKWYKISVKFDNGSIYSAVVGLK